jgi:anti-sigma regulatory factor (Ser/Thr protein kinase)
VHSWLAPLDLADDVEDDLVLAVNEAASNSIEHAYLPPNPGDTVEVTFWTEARAVCIEVADHGAWRVSARRTPGRGRGIEIMERVVSVHFHYDADGTRVLLRQSLSGRSESALRVTPGGT